MVYVIDSSRYFLVQFTVLNCFLFQITIINDQDLSLGSRMHAEDAENQSFTIQVASQGKSWLLRRTYQNFRSLDTQLHRCIYDRKFSALPELPPEDNLSVPQGQDHEVLKIINSAAWHLVLFLP